MSQQRAAEVDALAFVKVQPRGLVATLAFLTDGMVPGAKEARAASEEQPARDGAPHRQPATSRPRSSTSANAHRSLERHHPRNPPLAGWAKADSRCPRVDSVAG